MQATHEEPMDGIPLEDDLRIEFDDLRFEVEVAEGAFGKIFKGDYYGTPVAIKKCPPPISPLSPSEGPQGCSTCVHARRFMESGYPEDDKKYIAREVATLKYEPLTCLL